MPVARKSVAVLEAMELRRVSGNVRKVNEAAWVIATAKDQAERSQVAARPVVSTRPAATTGHTFTATGSGAPCDGDLPPCWRIIGTESGGRWDAYNPGGCVEHGVVYGCWGPYQFSGSWAGKLGIPLDIRTTSKEQWINAARQLWNHGAGCSNWSAC